MNPSSATSTRRFSCCSARKVWFGSDSVTCSQLYLSECAYGRCGLIFPWSSKFIVDRQNKPGQRTTSSLPWRVHCPPLLLWRRRRSILSVRWKWRRASTWAHATITHVIAPLLHGLLKLLLLSISHQRFQLLMRLHHGRAHLLTALLRAQRSVVPDRIHPLVLVLHDGQHLLLLIGCQIQHLCQVPQLMLRGWRPTMTHGLRPRIGLLIHCVWWRRRGRVLCKHRRRDTESHSENCDSRAHSSEGFPRIHLSVLSPGHAPYSNRISKSGLLTHGLSK